MLRNQKTHSQLPQTCKQQSSDNKSKDRKDLYNKKTLKH